MVDFNKALEKGMQLNKFDKDKIEIASELEFELQGRSNANFNQNSYSEVSLTGMEGFKPLTSQFNFGDTLSITELQENVRFEKLILLKSYSTQTNKFDKFKGDIIFKFVDRDGIEITSRAFGELDTSNQISYSEKLKALKGQVVLLEGRLVRKGERHFIEVRKVRESNVDQTLAKEFFQREVKGRMELIQKVWTDVVKYPLSNALYRQYEQVITSSSIKGVYERHGGYIYYFSILLNLVNNIPLEIKIKDFLLSFDLTNHLKQHVNNLELTKTLNHLAVSNYGSEEAESLLNDALFNSYTDKSVYELTLENLKKGILTLLLLEDWSKWDMDYVYSNLHKGVISIRRE